MFSAISAIATPTRSGIAGALASTDWIWLLFFTAVPLLLVCLGGRRHLPHGRSRAGDRHLKFYETRDNLLVGGNLVFVEFLEEDNPTTRELLTRALIFPDTNIATDGFEPLWRSTP